MTIDDSLMEQIQAEVCDSVCRLPLEASDQNELTELCKCYCPFNKLTEGSDNNV